MSEPDDPAFAPTVGSDQATAATAASSPRDAAVTLTIGARLGDRYVVRAFLGEGGMGAVYRALDEKLGEDVALKVVRGTLGTSAQLRDEVRIAQRVTHRNVCRTYDLEDIAGFHLVKMEFVDGETLAAVLARDGKLPIERTLAIARGIAEGLAAAHAQGIVHRDLKPGNVMIAGARVVLMDFGLAQSEGAAAIAGTPGYMAPEQLAGDAIDARADLYALGCVTYELLVGEPVFSTKGLELATDHLKTTPPDVRAKRPEVPRWLARAVAKLLAKDSDPRTAGLRALIGGPRRLAIPAAVVAMAVAAAISIAIVMHRTRPAWVGHIVPIAQELTGHDGPPALSPDGTRVVYASNLGVSTAPSRAYMLALGNPSATAITPVGENVRNVRWTRDGRALLYSSQEHVFRLPLGAVAEDLGPGDSADDCGDAIAIWELDFAGMRLVLRGPNGKRTLLRQLGALTHDFPSPPRCDPSSGLVAFAVGPSYPSACVGDVWTVGRDGAAHQLTTDHAACSVAFVPGGRSIVFSAKYAGAINLYEIPTEGGASHRVTDGPGPDIDPDVSADGKLVVFQHETISSTVVVGNGSVMPKTIPVHIGVVDSFTPTNDFVYLIAQRTDPGGGEVIEAIRIADDSEIILGRGIIGFPSFDGSQVYFRTIDRGDELRVVSIRGGDSSLVARFPGQIALGAGTADGVHVVIDREHRFEGWRINSDGRPEAEQAAGLVIPAATGGWRMEQIFDGFFRIELVPPNAPLSAPVREIRAISIFNQWINDHWIAIVGMNGKLEIIDAETGEARVVETPTNVDIWSSSVLGAGGENWATIDFHGEASRQLITNFADRPWAR